MSSNMRVMRYISAVVSVVMLLSCSGNVDDSSLPVLEVSDVEIDLATETQAEFTVIYDGEDVTDESVISSQTAQVQGRLFIPDAEGTYSFVAQYAGKQSNEVAVSVIDSSPEKVESKYDRHVCVVEFTGAWCINCPEGYDKMMGILSKPSMAKYKDNIHICAFHSDLEGTDTLAIPATQDLFRMFDGLAYPSFATDFRESGILTSDGISVFQPSIAASFNDWPAHCGVAVSSELDQSGMHAHVTAKVTSELTSEYRIVILVVQDRIKGYQKTPTWPEGQSDYNHSHVVRKVVTSYPGTFTGEKLTDDGRIASGSEVSRSWSVAIDSSWVIDDTEIYAIVLDSNGYVNNMNICAIDGGDSGYDMK